jgi:hypothetical protein
VETVQPGTLCIQSSNVDGVRWASLLAVMPLLII